MKKHLFSAATLAIALFATTAAVAQTTPDTGDKTKTTVDGMTVKTKVADDGKMKVKGKDDAGNRMKATTKPRKGDMKDGMDMQAGDMKMHHKGMKGMHRKDKGMRKDSAAMGTM
jgi:hypothetical protein